MKPGIYSNIPNDEYHIGPGISSSELKLILKSPAHYRYASDNPRPQTANMALGTAAHTKILEPDGPPVLPEPEVNRRTKDGKAELAQFHADNPDAIICSAEQYTHVVGMRDAVLMHPTAAVLFAAGRAETSNYWIDEATGELCKKRDDWYNDDMELIVDLKTAADAGRDCFLRACVNFSYELSAMYYLEGCKQSLQPSR